MIDYLPASLRGLMVAAFAAAFMSTVGTQLNWGASYLVNDFYRRFLKPATNPERHYVRFADRHRAADRHLGAVTRTIWIPSPAPGSCLSSRARARARAHSALVLVAHQRVERSLGHGRGVRWFRSVLQTAFHLDSDDPGAVRASSS
jgi:hypothetical protein